MPKVQPLADRILLKRTEAEEQMRGGIIIPDTAREKPLEAEVVAVGPGKLDKDGKRVAVGVKVGDRVLIGRYAGTDVEIDDEEVAIVNEDDVLGILQ